MSLKELRKQKKLTQTECAAYLGVPLRTYQNYENDKSKHTSIKYMYMLQKLEQYGFIDETHGILSIQKHHDIFKITACQINQFLLVLIQLQIIITIIHRCTLNIRTLAAAPAEHYDRRVIVIREACDHIVCILGNRYFIHSESTLAVCVRHSLAVSASCTFCVKIIHHIIGLISSFPNPCVQINRCGSIH